MVFATVAWTLSLAGLWFLRDVTAGLPGSDALGAVGRMAQATTVYDRHDRPVFVLFREQRLEIPLARVSPHLVQAVLAIEDQRFYEHRGIDVVRIAAATLVNLREGRAVQGGSTITQQLARQSFLTADKTLRRKLKEVLLAAHLEQAYTKDRILELYLNKVYFGGGLYGAEAAARGFFGKPAADLSVAEAALLAGLIKAPSHFAPSSDLPRAIARRNVVLQAMRDRALIDADTHERARAADVTLQNALQREAGFGEYFREQVRIELVERFGAERVYEGGLRVYTTIDADMQQAAEEAVEASLQRIERRADYRHAGRPADAAALPATGADYLQGALIALDPQSGHVRALVGGRSYADSRFNRALQARRQPGSAFKPLVFAAAIESGLTPASVIDHLDDPVLTAQGAWLPDDGQSEAEFMTLRTALRTSSNRAAVRLLQDVGVGRLVHYADRMRVGRMPPVPSLALGSGEVTLASLTAAYGAFAAGGAVHRPVFIRRVEERDGERLFEAAGDAVQAIDPSTAFLVASMLADVVDAGTAARARAEGFTLPAGGKTGTTNGYADAWFVGFTPTLVAGVWVGFDRPRTIAPGGYATQLAVPAWASFMKAATRGQRPDWIERPRNIVALPICLLSGKRPADGCTDVPVLAADGDVEVRSLVRTEYFVLGTQPEEACDLHPGRSWIERFAGAFRGVEARPPIAVSAAGLPQVAAAPAAPAGVGDVAGAVTAKEAEEERPRRGFWSRLFGRGGDRQDD